MYSNHECLLWVLWPCHSNFGCSPETASAGQNFSLGRGPRGKPCFGFCQCLRPMGSKIEQIVVMQDETRASGNLGHVIWHPRVTGCYIADPPCYTTPRGEIYYVMSKFYTTPVMSRCHITCYKTSGGIIYNNVLQERVLHNRGCYITCYKQVL